MFDLLLDVLRSQCGPRICSSHFASATGVSLMRFRWTSSGQPRVVEKPREKPPLGDSAVVCGLWPSLSPTPVKGSSTRRARGPGGPTRALGAADQALFATVQPRRLLRGSRPASAVCSDRVSGITQRAMSLYSNWISP